VALLLLGHNAGAFMDRQPPEHPHRTGERRPLGPGKIALLEAIKSAVRSRRRRGNSACSVSARLAAGGRDQQIACAEPAVAGRDRRQAGRRRGGHARGEESSGFIGIERAAHSGAAKEFRAVDRLIRKGSRAAR